MYVILQITNEYNITARAGKYLPRVEMNCLAGRSADSLLSRVF